jgi:hypothetical protein
VIAFRKVLEAARRQQAPTPAQLVPSRARTLPDLGGVDEQESDVNKDLWPTLLQTAWYVFKALDTENRLDLLYYIAYQEEHTKE